MSKIALKLAEASFWSDAIEVGDLPETLGKAKTAGVTVLVGPYTSRGRNAAILGFPGGPIVEVPLAGR